MSAEANANREGHSMGSDRMVRVLPFASFAASAILFALYAFWVSRGDTSAAQAGGVSGGTWIVGSLVVGLPLVVGLFLLAGAASRRIREGAAALAQLQAEMSRREGIENERRRKETFYKAHYDNTADSIFVVKIEDDGRFTMADRNSAHVAHFGSEGVPFIGKELRDLVPEEEARWLESFYRKCAETRGPITYSVFFGLDREPRHWETVLAPISDEGGKITHVIGASRDITDRIELQEKLRQSQKMEALGKLTGGIAHDFNNLLTVVMGNLDLLQRAKEDRRPALISKALQAVDRARELTQQLLAFGRRQPLRPEVIDLQVLVAGMDDMLMQSLRGDIRLDLELADDLWPVRVDPAQLQVAMINLAANARDAMPKGGTLRVKAQNTSLRHGPNRDGVALSVTDTGHGMSREIAARAFDPFFTTKEVGRGTGLGLAQVYGFAEQSGGSVEIQSEPGEGTTVTLYLPRGKGQPAAPAPKATEHNVAERHLNILLVEDNVQVAEVAASILRERGQTITVAHSADDAMVLLEEGQAFDIVFSDLVMPGDRDGLDLARTIRHRWPSLPVLLATGYSEAGGRAAQEGYPLLLKPYQPDRLVSMLQQVFADHRPGSVTTARAS